MTDPYSILDVSPNATDEEIKAAYKNLVKKYHPDNYDDNNPLKELATEKMQQINAAYDEIQRIRSGASSGESTYSDHSSSNGIYREIRNEINQKNYPQAQRMLYAILEDQRTAEWHYLNSIILVQRNMLNDAMRELETACSMDPSNLEYQRAKEMFNQQANAYGNNYYGSAAGAPPRRDAADEACDCCANLVCLDCLCECMGGDLIRCI